MRHGIVIILSLLSVQATCIEDTYRSQLGVRENTGYNDGLEVEMYLAATGLGRGYAWCAAFLTWCHRECGQPYPSLPAWSPSWFGEHVIYQRGVITYGSERYRTPEPGDVFGIYFPSKQRIAHVGFVDEWTDGKYFVTVEGNTNEAGSREGDGVYRKFRLKSQIEAISRWQ